MLRVDQSPVQTRRSTPLIVAFTDSTSRSGLHDTEADAVIAVRHRGRARCRPGSSAAAGAFLLAFPPSGR